MSSVGSWAGRTALVTGAGGLLGGWVTAVLAEAGARVVAVDFDWAGRDSLWPFPGSVQLAKADIRDEAEIRRLITEAEASVVAHLAAQSIVGAAKQDPVATFETNIQGTWSVLEACRTSGSVTSAVVASTEMVYGEGTEEPFVEPMPIRPGHPYAASKASAELIARAYALSYEMGIGICRFGSLFGGGDLNWSRIIPGTIRSALQDESPVIRSDGRYVRDYLYVRDAAQAVLDLLRAVESSKDLRGEAFNFAASERLSVRDLVSRILRLTGTSLEPTVLNESATNDRNPPLDASRARDVIGWTPRHSLDEGLLETIDWYRRFLKQET